LIRYRPFLNHDLPAIAEIWRSQPPQRGLMQPLTPQIFEQHVLSKTYFDRLGLILAFDDKRPMGFVHAGFGPRNDKATLGSERGCICLLQVVPAGNSAQVASELLTLGEQHLLARGVKEIFGGPSPAADPFYLGLSGGSRQLGVLSSDRATSALFRAAAYVESQSTIVLQRGLAGFRAPVDRRQMQLRRQYQVETVFDPVPLNWWEACLWGETERTRFTLVDRAKSTTSGFMTFWTMQPLAGSWGVQAAGLSQLEVIITGRRQGLATFLLGESFRQLQAQGVTLVEVQIPQDNAAALGLYLKLGFEEVDRATVFRKPA